LEGLTGDFEALFIRHAAQFSPLTSDMTLDQRVGLQRRSAGFQPAVSQVFNLHCDRIYLHRLASPASWQDTILLYFPNLGRNICEIPIIRGRALVWLAQVRGSSFDFPSDFGGSVFGFRPPLRVDIRPLFPLCYRSFV
jgi:hypothetical protein